jgi:hypothetical protein
VNFYEITRRDISGGSHLHTRFPQNLKFTFIFRILSERTIFLIILSLSYLCVRVCVPVEPPGAWVCLFQYVDRHRTGAGCPLYRCCAELLGVAVCSDYGVTSWDVGEGGGAMEHVGVLIQIDCRPLH